MNINTTGRSLQPLTGSQGVRVKPTSSTPVPANYAIHRLNQPVQAPPQDQSTVNTTLKQAGGLENPGMVSFPNLSPEKLAKDVSQTSPHIRRVQRIPTVQNLSHSRPVALGPTPSTGGNPRVQSRSVSAKAPTQNVSDAQAEKMGAHYRKKLNDRMQAAPPQSKVGQYYRTTQLLQEYAYYKQTGKGPLADDPQARELVEANLKFLEQKARDLAESPEVKKLFADVRQESVQATFGAQAPTVAKHYANYLLSDEFAAELKKMPPEERKAALAKASLKLAALDPKMAKETIHQLAKQQLQEQLVENLNKKGPEGDQARAALEATLREKLQGAFGNGQDAADKVNKLVEQLMDAFEKNPKLLLSPEGMNEALQSAAKSFQNMKDLPARLQAEMQAATKGLTRGNVLGSVLSVAALVNGVMILGGGPRSVEEVLKASGNITSGIAGLGAVGKALSLADDSKALAKLAKLGALGPLGDALGVAADIAGFMQEGANEDEVGRYLKAVSAATGIAATLAGTAVLLGCSSPLAPIVLAGAAAAGLAISAADYLYAESEKTGEVRQLLRDTGLSAKQDVIKAKFEEAAGFTDDYALMQKQFQGLKSTESRARYINQILDNKDVWINPSRKQAAYKMLQSLSGQELEALIQQGGLHMGMVGRKLGDHYPIVQGIMEKLDGIKTPAAQKARAEFLNGVAKGGHKNALEYLKRLSPERMDALLKGGLDFETWGAGMGADPALARQVIDTLSAANTPAARKALAAFLRGLVKGGHDATFRGLLDPPEAGRKLIGQLPAEDLKGMIQDTPDRQLTMKLLNLSSWSQFNEIMEGPDARQFLATLRSRFMDTEDVGFLGTLAAWGENPKASKGAKDRLRDWFNDSQLNHNLQEKNYGRSADAFVKELSDEQLKNLNPALKTRLQSAAQVASSYYLTPETRARLKAAGIIQ